MQCSNKKMIQEEMFLLAAFLCFFFLFPKVQQIMERATVGNHIVALFEFNVQ